MDTTKNGAIGTVVLRIRVVPHVEVAADARVHQKKAGRRTPGEFNREDQRPWGRRLPPDPRGMGADGSGFQALRPENVAAGRVATTSRPHHSLWKLQSDL